MTETSENMADATPVPFRVGFVPGVTPDKWSRIWNERVRDARLEVRPIGEHDQTAVLHERRADMSFVRLPIDRTGLELIPLYHEVAVVVVPVDHPITTYAETAEVDLAGESLLKVPPMSYREAITAVANGAGAVVVPMSVARLHHRKDLAHRPVTDVAQTQIGLAWLSGTADPRIETFIGIVRGRTERSSRAGEPAGRTAGKRSDRRGGGARRRRGSR